MMASPRAAGPSSNPNRPLAYKSPAVKTPASAHGHGHHVSVSSQPSSTPLTATAIHDDILALNSPATALINSLGPTGMTPLGSAGDGLGITTHLPAASTRGGAATTTLNPEMERIHRLQQVADTLKSRVAGHGVTREGVERIAQLQGFTTLWDDDNLTIAGNTVDLEVMFDADDRDRVTDVSLKLNTSESEEPTLQVQGTEVLKDNLKPFTRVRGVPQWTSLDTFESNLQYLSQLDHIEGGAPCFDAITDLYDAFQKIWKSEREHSKGRSFRQHLRHGAVGRPIMDRKPRLGLSLDYWVAREEFGAATGEDSLETLDNLTETYSARISCQPGAPLTMLAKEWLSDQVLAPEAQSELDSETPILKPDWRDPAHAPETSDLVAKGDPEEPTTEKPAGVSPTVLEMHFVASLFPEVHLPLNVAASLNVELAMLELDQELTVTYQTALQEQFNASKVGSAKTISEERWPRRLPTTTEDDPQRFRRHSYALHSAQPAATLWCYPIKQLRFTHPRQLADVLPTLRQYALVWSVLRSLVAYAATEQDDRPDAADVLAAKASSATNRPTKRSNAKAATSKLHDLLGPNSHLTSGEVLPVDVSLDIISNISKARLDIYVPLHGNLAKDKHSPFIFVSLNICRGGTIQVDRLRGVQPEGADDSSLRSRIVRIVTATEDIGLLVEWLLGQARTTA